MSEKEELKSGREWWLLLAFIGGMPVMAMLYSLVSYGTLLPYPDSDTRPVPQARLESGAATGQTASVSEPAGRISPAVQEAPASNVTAMVPVEAIGVEEPSRIPPNVTIMPPPEPVIIALPARAHGEAVVVGERIQTAAPAKDGGFSLDSPNAAQKEPEGEEETAVKSNAKDQPAKDE